MKLVETITYLTEELFTITFSHTGFDNLAETTLSETLTLQPDINTEKLLRDHSAGYFFSNNTLVCYTRCRLLTPPAPQPRAVYIIPAPGLRFRFLLKADTKFMNMTIIEPAAAGRYYYFSNRVNAGTGMFISHDAAEVTADDLQNIPDVNPRDTPLAVIDIFTNGAISNSYELLAGASGELRRPAYRVLFRSRI